MIMWTVPFGEGWVIVKTVPLTCMLCVLLAMAVQPAVSAAGGETAGAGASGAEAERVILMSDIGAAGTVSMPGADTAGMVPGAETARVVPMPRAETADVICGWLQRSGFRVARTRGTGDGIEIRALRGADEWAVSIAPHSPLASDVEASYAVNGEKMDPQVKSLWNFLDGYARGSSAEVGASNTGVPASVLEKIESIVCISAVNGGQRLQFSGFVVDPAGLVLCTAHNLDGVEEVRVTLFDGKGLAGKIIGLDPARDIALIDVTASFGAAVSLAGGKGKVGMGERIFSVGCPESLGGTVYSGFVNGPPRLVGGQYLLQADMQVYPGSSGSPVFDAQGNLVAMVKGRFRGTDSMGFLIPHETILDFIRDGRKGE